MFVFSIVFINFIQLVLYPNFINFIQLVLYPNKFHISHSAIQILKHGYNFILKIDEFPPTTKLSSGYCGEKAVKKDPKLDLLYNATQHSKVELLLSFFLYVIISCPYTVIYYGRYILWKKQPGFPKGWNKVLHILNIKNLDTMLRIIKTLNNYKIKNPITFSQYLFCQ